MRSTRGGIHRVGFIACIAFATVMARCKPNAQSRRSAIAVSESTQAAQLAIAAFRRLSHDRGEVVVARFLRAGDSIVIGLAPAPKGSVPPPYISLRPGGHFVVREGRVVTGSLIE